MEAQKRNVGQTDDQPTTQEALPGVELGADDETEQRGRETLGPEAADEEEDG
jgi:hypothetical protein